MKVLERITEIKRNQMSCLRAVAMVAVLGILLCGTATAVPGDPLLNSFAVGASQLMPLPAFDRTFSDSNLTRGYWFEAPADFVITGLRVPDEIGHGRQNIELVRFNNNTPPPKWDSTTNDFMSLVRFVNQPSANILAVNIPVFAGEVIGILGAAGTTTMHNSYAGMGTFVSEIVGYPVTLTSMGMQFNLYNEPAHNIWQKPDHYVSRVEMYYVPEPGTILLVGGGGLALMRKRRQQ